MTLKKALAVLLCAAFALLSLCACSGKGEQTTTNPDAIETKATADSSQPESKEDKETKDTQSKETSNMEHTKVKVKMKKFGEFTIELYPEYAPATVNNFISLVKEGFYDGLTFHRVVAGFMAQGGDPQGTGFGGSKRTIKGEFSSNGFKQNTLSHTRGVISMARGESNDSASSQFFICYSDEDTFLDGNYAAFGKVIEGMDVVDSFCDVELKTNSIGEKAVPATPIVIDSMTIEK